MGVISPRPCRKPGCPALVRGRIGYCETHRREAKHDEMASYNRMHPERASSPYGTARWRRAAKAHLAAHPCCTDPFGVHGEFVPFAEVVDHVEPVRLGGEFWDSTNWQGLCRSCHERKTALERGG